MPRQARLDAPGTLHHVIVRGLENGQIVKDDRDRSAFLTRLAGLLKETETVIYAWALLPNHAHFLLRSGPSGLPKFMRRLLTGYAITFNRRHKRVGHLFQNRYRSIVCEEDSYFMELVRYIHLNPLRAGLVRDLRALDRYPWSGHAAVVGRMKQPWQDRRTVLGRFGTTNQRATRAYLEYLEEGIPRGRRPELVGGGLIRSAGGWAEVRGLRQRKELTAADPRILGRGEFVEAMWRKAEPMFRSETQRRQAIREATEAIHNACVEEGISVEELRAGSRRGALPSIRAKLASHLVTQLGLPLAEVARQLGVSTSAISKTLARFSEE